MGLLKLLINRKPEAAASQELAVLQVGKQCLHAPSQMRTELWASQVQRNRSKAGAPGEYYDLLFETLDPGVADEIEKDAPRTFPRHRRLSTPGGQRALCSVLRAYALADPALGYTQGMNFLGGLLLAWLPGEADAYAALRLLMRARGLRELYAPDMRALQARLWQLSKLLPPALAAHLEAHAVLPVLYAAGWLLTCFAADFPLHFAARVMDFLLTGPEVASPLLKVAVGLVAAHERQLLALHDFEQLVGLLRHDIPALPADRLHALLGDALSEPWTPHQLEVLEEMDAAETVAEAVARVERLSGPSSALPTPATPDHGEDGAPGPEQQGQQQRAAGVPRAGSAPKLQQLAQEAAAGGLAASVPSIARLSQLLPPQLAASLAQQQASWLDSWQSLAQLQTMPRPRIARSIGEGLEELDPQLSTQLSAYLPPPPSAGAGHAPGPAARVAGAARPPPSPFAPGAGAPFAGAPAAAASPQQQGPARACSCSLAAASPTEYRSVSLVAHLAPSSSQQLSRAGSTLLPAASPGLSGSPGSGGGLQREPSAPPQPAAAPAVSFAALQRRPGRMAAAGGAPSMRAQQPPLPPQHATAAPPEPAASSSLLCALDSELPLISTPGTREPQAGGRALLPAAGSSGRSSLQSPATDSGSISDALPSQGGAAALAAAALRQLRLNGGDGAVRSVQALGLPASDAGFGSFKAAAPLDAARFRQAASS